MKKTAFFIGLFVTLATLALVNSALSYTLPQDDSRAKYFYVFGPQGNTDLGAEVPEQVLYIDVPQESAAEVRISIFDPDTVGDLDLKESDKNPWDTNTEFSVYGANDELLDKKEFRDAKEYDRKYHTFGPYAKEQGENVGNRYRFKLVAKAISGDDENLYNVVIEPENAEAFTYNLTIRLLEREGEKMYFYPEIPEGANKITVENYDIDPNGGTSQLFDLETGKRYSIKDSGSAQWAKTEIAIQAKDTKRLQYVITKKTQRRANAGLRVLDESGRELPIYFTEKREGIRVAVVKETPNPLPKTFSSGKCNDTFTFDGTQSHDPTNRKLTFHWDFGDGSAGEKPVETHTYQKPGEYTVTLTVKNDSGLECDTDISTTTVKVNSAPKAEFSSVQTSCRDQEIVFDASSTRDETSDNLTYKWDFGDGTTGEGQRVTKAYKKGGKFIVRLTVDDNENTPCSKAIVEKATTIIEPPVANAGEDLEMCVAANQDFRVSFNAASGGSRNLTYTWDFGDANTAEGRSVIHTYKEPGTYNVVLKVDDGLGLACSTSTDVLKVTLNRQPLADAGEDISTCSGSEVNFDGSGSSSGENFIYSWDFGDADKGEGAKVAHTYRKGGAYMATLTVDSGSGSKCAKAEAKVKIMVNSAPEASLAKVDPVCPGANISFDASGSKDPDGNVLLYTWDFGDGTVTKGSAKMNHVYKEGGVYVVTVTVDDQQGSPCSFTSASTKVRVNRPPVANAGPNTVCCMGTDSKFDGSGSTDPDADELTYTWDFGDGATAKGQKVTHRYTKPGQYKVTLTVKDNSGTSCNSSFASFTATVSDKPVSVIKVR